MKLAVSSMNIFSCATVEGLARCITPNQRDLGDRTARVVSIKLSQRGKQRVVESDSHSDTDHHPRHNKTGQVGCSGEQDQAQRDDEAAAREDHPAADSSDPAADHRRQQP
jgi:hypothetical protein